MATRTVITKILIDLSFLPNAPITSANTKSVVDQYEEVLGDISDDALTAAKTFFLADSNPFFPMPGQLREKAIEMQLIALGVPTPAEAWAMVGNARRWVQAEYCREGADLRDKLTHLTAGHYLRAGRELRDHEVDCRVCQPAGYRENFEHEAVAETVRRLGGRGALYTDNLAADRARFIEAYKDVISRLTTMATMPKAVREFVSGESQRLLDADRSAAFETGERDEMRKQIRRLAGGMTG